MPHIVSALTESPDSLLVELASHHIQHVQKSLTQMNVQLQHLISDITGMTGKAILEAILKGERDAAKLAQLRQPEIKADRRQSANREKEIGARNICSRCGSPGRCTASMWRPSRSDRQISKFLEELDPQVDLQQRPLPADNKRRTKRKNKRTGDFRFDVRTKAYKRFGVDVTWAPGLDGIALSLYSELGADLSKWPSANQFASWAALCPDNDKTGGRVVYTGVRAMQHRVGQLFRQAANSLHHSSSRMGAHLRRMKAKLGPPAALPPPLTKSPESSMPWSRTKLNTMKPTGKHKMNNGNVDWKPNSSGKLTNLAISLYPFSQPPRPNRYEPAGSLGVGTWQTESPRHFQIEAISQACGGAGTLA